MSKSNKPKNQLDSTLLDFIEEQKATLEWREPVSSWVCVIAWNDARRYFWGATAREAIEQAKAFLALKGLGML